MSGPITQGTTNLITVLLLPVAIAMIAYALTTFYARSIYLQRKQVRAHAGRPAAPIVRGSMRHLCAPCIHDHDCCRVMQGKPRCSTGC